MRGPGIGAWVTSAGVEYATSDTTSSSKQTGPLPVSIAGTGTGTVTVVPTSAALTDRSVTIATGGTAQQAAAALATRKYLFIQNPSASGGTLWFSATTTAVQASPSIELPPGGSYENPAHFCPTGAISVIHPTTSALITVKEA
jgi:hypothetical protein